MSIKLTAQQKSKPIYTSDAMRTAWPAVWDIIHPIHMRENRQRRKKEYFWAFGIDKERYLKFAELLAHACGLAGLGGENRVHIKPAEALRLAITKETQFVIYIHNHPGGTLTPSAEDKDATDRLIKAADTAYGGTSVVDIKVVDHFIITETQYFSFAEAGLMKQLRDSSTYRVSHEDEVELLKLQFEAQGEAKRATAMALKMLKDGFSVTDVVKYSGLKKKAVEGLGKT